MEMPDGTSRQADIQASEQAERQYFRQVSSQSKQACKSGYEYRRAERGGQAARDAEKQAGSYMKARACTLKEAGKWSLWQAG